MLLNRFIDTKELKISNLHKYLCLMLIEGPQCEICMDGWFGQPRGRGPCLQCTCNKNIDTNAVMNCNRTTGECLKCIHNTTGFHCESCLPGYFGRAVTNNPDERCRREFVVDLINCLFFD